MKSEIISRRTALKSLFVLSVIPSFFITSCTQSLTAPESAENQKVSLFKSQFDADIAAFESYSVSNKNGIAEIHQKYIYSPNDYVYVLSRIGTTNFSLAYRKIEIISKDRASRIFKVKGLDDGTVLIANSRYVVNKLKEIDKKELKKRFNEGVKLVDGGK